MRKEATRLLLFAGDQEAFLEVPSLAKDIEHC